MAGDGEEADPDGAALVVALNEDLSDEEDEEDGAAADQERQRGGPDEDGGGQEGGAALFEEEVAAADAARREEAARARLLMDMEGAEAGGAADGYGLGVAGRARLNREVTYQHFVSAMWPKITSECMQWSQMLWHGQHTAGDVACPAPTKEHNSRTALPLTVPLHLHLRPAPCSPRAAQPGGARARVPGDCELHQGQRRSHLQVRRAAGLGVRHGAAASICDDFPRNLM